MEVGRPKRRPSDAPLLLDRVLLNDLGPAPETFASDEPTAMAAVGTPCRDVIMSKSITRAGLAYTHSKWQDMI